MHQSEYYTQKSIVHIVQLDRTKVEVVGEIASVSIRLSSNPKVSQIIDILVDDIPKFYGLILSRDWSKKLHRYFPTDRSHMWLLHDGKPNQIRVDHEKFMKYIVIDLEGRNEPVAFINNIIGNYSAELFLGSFNAQRYLFPNNVVISQIESFSQTDASKCVDIVDKVVNNSLFWILYFDGSKSEDGASAGCILINPQGEKTMLACRLEFQYTNNTEEYEALIQGMYKAIGLIVKYLKIYGDSKIFIKRERNKIHYVSGHLKHYQ